MAYDHGEFPKIVSVHSMADSHNAMQDYPDDSDNSSPPASVETEPNTACPLPGPPITAVSLCSENSTRESNEYAGKPLEYEICGNIGGYGNNDKNLNETELFGKLLRKVNQLIIPYLQF